MLRTCFLCVLRTRPVLLHRPLQALLDHNSLILAQEHNRYKIKLQWNRMRWRFAIIIELRRKILTLSSSQPNLLHHPRHPSLQRFHRSLHQGYFRSIDYPSHHRLPHLHLQQRSFFFASEVRRSWLLMELCWELPSTGRTTEQRGFVMADDDNFYVINCPKASTELKIWKVFQNSNINVRTARLTFK